MSSSSSSASGDHFEWYKGQSLGNSRYVVLSELGEGTFGRVLKCFDRNYRDIVAVKVIRDVDRYVKNAQVEVDILDKLFRSGGDSRGRDAIVRLHDAFFHRSRYYCIVFEPLGRSLYDILKDNHHRGFYMSDVQAIVKSILSGMYYCHSRGLSHTDIKAENIMLVTDTFIECEPPPWYSSLHDALNHLKHSDEHSSSNRYLRPNFRNDRVVAKLIDFGNGTFRNDHHSTIISTRQYRGPEVILQHGWDESSDIWSLGCVFAELFCGELLFGTHCDLEHLAMIERTLFGRRGKIPHNFLDRTPGNLSSEYQRWEVNNVCDPRVNVELIGRSRSRDRLLPREEEEEGGGGAGGRRMVMKKGGGWVLDFPDALPSNVSVATSLKKVEKVLYLRDLVSFQPFEEFYWLLKGLLQIYPERRLRAREALQEPFVTRTEISFSR